MNVEAAVAAHRRARHEAVLILPYTVAYFAYLFVNPERELLHWITLVVVPVAGIAFVGRYGSVRAVLASLGLAPGFARRGWGLVLGLAVAFQVLQLLNRSQRTAVLEVMAEPRGLLLLPLAFVLLLGTAATTEEVYFRGLVQTRLAHVLRSDAAAALLGTGIFILYHIPYAYLSPGWPSAGDLPAAVRAAVVNGGVGGLPLSLLFWRSGRNLAAAIVLHASMDLIPAIRLLDRLLAAA